MARVSNTFEMSSDISRGDAIMEDSLPSLMGRQSSQLKQLKEVVQPTPTCSPTSRKDQNVLLFLMNAIIAFVISFQNIILVFTNKQESKGYMSIAVMIGMISVSLISTYHMRPDLGKVLQMYTLVDNIFLMQIVSSFGFIGFLMVISDGKWYHIVSMIAFPLEIIFFIGNFRVLLLYVRWTKLQMVIYKIILMAGAVLFFQIGALYMDADFSYSGGTDPVLDGAVKDFVLLYIFGMFTLFVQVYARMTDIDQTTQLKYAYQFKEMSQQQKLEHIRQSIRQSIRATAAKPNGARSRFAKDKPKQQYLAVEPISQIS